MEKNKQTTYYLKNQDAVETLLTDWRFNGKTKYTFADYNGSSFASDYSDLGHEK